MKVNFIFISIYIIDNSYNEIDSKENERNQEHDEKSEINDWLQVVSFSNAVSQKGTVMVEDFNTVITVFAMDGSWRSKYFTGVAIF
jgi:hypothetical protein